MKKVALYIRVSTEEQARIQDGSLVSQRKRLEEFVEGQNRRQAGWGTVTGIYVDEGKSAKDMNRPEFQRMLTDLRAGKINLILATELSRLSRSIKDFCEVWELFKECGASFITLREHFDTTTAAGEMMVFNLINFAQFERKQTSERISANFKSRAERGLWNGGVLPLGYDRDPENPGKLRVNSKEARTVKLIFETFLKTGNLRETCIKLNKMGLRTKEYVNRKGERQGGNHFTVQSLHHLLTNATFTGMREVGKRRGELTLVPAQWKPIIDKSAFQTARKRLEKNRRCFKPDEWKTYSYPLTGIAVCGECGRRLNGKSAHGKTQKHHYYDHPRTLAGNGTGHLHKCRIQRLRAQRVEEMVLASLKTLLADPVRIKEGVALHQKHSSQLAPLNLARLKTLRDESKLLEKREKNLIARIAELPQNVSATAFYTQLSEIQKQSAEKTKLKYELECPNTTQNTTVTPDDVAVRIQRTLAVLEKAPKADQRAIFENVIQFAEFHATKLRLGVFAATGTDGGSAQSGPSRSGRSRGSKNLSIVGSRTFGTGGESGIRTHGKCYPTHAFQACALSHSAISPNRTSKPLAQRGGLCQTYS
jgi:site-specific DNA recombinase